MSLLSICQASPQDPLKLQEKTVARFGYRDKQAHIYIVICYNIIKSLF